MKSLTVAALGVALALAPVPHAAAQVGPVRWMAQRMQVGGSAVFMRPLGAFADQVDATAGLGFAAVVRPHRSSPLGIRISGATMRYGRETVRVPLAVGVPRLQVDVHTDNAVFMIGAGPQVMLGHGRLRPYLFGTAGVAYFTTVTSGEGSSALSRSFARSTSFDDATLALSGGVGVLIGLTRGLVPVALDVSVEGVRHGTVTYLVEGGIADQPDGTLTFTPRSDHAGMLQVRIGLAIGR